MKPSRLEELKAKVDKALRILAEQDEKLECPLATQDVKLNTKNRNLARKNHSYGPMNPLQKSTGYWKEMSEKWTGATVKEARGMRCGNCVAFDVSERMQACMPISGEQVNPEDMSTMDIVNAQLVKEPRESFPGIPKDDDFFLGFGYCWMHHFKCHSARSCDTYAAGGPIDEDEQSAEWQEKSAGAAG